MAIPYWVPDDTFAKRLKDIRHHLHLSQEEAAEKCGINPKTWATWELGANPRRQNAVVQTISDALGVNPIWLAFGDNGIRDLDLHSSGWMYVSPGQGRLFEEPFPRGRDRVLSAA